MNIAEIEKLARVQGYPAVSILCRLDRRRPGNLEDPRRLDTLRRRAIELVRARADTAGARALVERIEAAVDRVDLAHPANAVAILVTAEESHVLPLPFPVPSRVVVDETFATRDLVASARRALHARVLVVAAEDARGFETTGLALTELHGDGFPLHLSVARQEDTPHRDLPIGEHEAAEARRQVARAVDDALDGLQRRERLPIVLVGEVRALAYFDEVTRHGADIVGRVHGNHLADSVDTIERLVEPALVEERRRREDAAVRRARDAVGPGAAAGFEEVATTAADGRGHELVVEESLRVEPSDPAGADDPVDEVVEAVLAHGGTVTTVPDGSLAEHGGIVLILRY